MIRALAMFLTVCALASAAMAASSIGGGSGGSGGSTTAGTSYTVSDGAYASGGYTDIASPTNLNLTKNGLSGVIAPTGFSVNFFGSAYTSFRVGTNGYILMDSSSSIVGTTPNVPGEPMPNGSAPKGIVNATELDCSQVT